MTSNAYFGCESVVEALNRGADMVLTGRLADSALILGPAMYEFGWKMNDWDKLAAEHGWLNSEVRAGDNDQHGSDDDDNSSDDDD